MYCLTKLRICKVINTYRHWLLVLAFHRSRRFKKSWLHVTYSSWSQTDNTEFGKVDVFIFCTIRYAAEMSAESAPWSDLFVVKWVRPGRGSSERLALVTAVVLSLGVCGAPQFPSNIHGHLRDNTSMCPV